MRLLSIAIPLLATAAVSGPRIALRELAERADAGQPDAIYQLARLHDTGFDSIPVDSVRASDLFRQAAEKGYAPAQNQYGFRLYNGLGGLKADPYKGLEWMEKAAMAGDPTAANNLGWLLMEGKDIRHDFEDAAFWLGKAADAGMPHAMSMLADLFREGKGVEKDSLKAISLYNRAIEAGLGDAQLKLLSMQEKAWKDLSADEAIATGLYYYTHRAPALGVRLFEQAADEGSPLAHALLGDALTRAQGASYNHDLALKHYFLAAKGGVPAAEFVIGELLEFFPDALDALTGVGEISDDERSAAYWLGRAAEAGITEAAQATESLLGSRPSH